MPVRFCKQFQNHLPQLEKNFCSISLNRFCPISSVRFVFEFVRFFPYYNNLVFLQLTTDIGVVLKSCTNQSSDTKQLEESMSQLNSTPEAARLSSLLHLTCLLFEVSSLLVCAQSVW